VYYVVVTGFAEPEVITRLTRGIRDGRELLKARRARIDSANNTRSVLEIELTEGKNREVRRLLAGCGFTVERLVRTAIGPLKLGDLPAGKWRTLTDVEIKSLLPR
jgi:23S rRNA pseudouridine2605 synthase